MLHYLLREDKKQHIIKHHGEEKYEEMLLHLNDPDKILLTQKSILPAFLDQAIEHSLVYVY
jgi:homoserine O-succinyltransferase/O-acetyltransferase